MELYRLEDIIRFLLRQEERQYKDLTEVLYFAKHATMDPFRKRCTVITALRACDLYEIGCEIEKFIYDEDAYQLSEIESIQISQGKFIPVIYQIFPCERVFINGIARFDVVLN